MDALDTRQNYRSRVITLPANGTMCRQDRRLVRTKISRRWLRRLRTNHPAKERADYLNYLIAGALSRGQSRGLHEHPEDQRHRAQRRDAGRPYDGQPTDAASPFPGPSGESSQW